MEKVAQVIDQLSAFFGRMSGILMIFGVVLIIAEIVVRVVFGSTLYITEEYTAYLMVSVTFLGLAYTLKEKGHIRMVFLHKLIKGGKGRTFLDLYSFLVGFIVFVLITFTTFNYFWDSVISGTRSMQISKTYLAIPQFAMPLGSLLITLQFASEFIKSVIRLRGGEMDIEEAESQTLGR
jgi:TRAP-type C4-dicarboxylate transport system permease small subunit